MSHDRDTNVAIATNKSRYYDGGPCCGRLPIHAVHLGCVRVWR